MLAAINFVVLELDSRLEVRNTTIPLDVDEAITLLLHRNKCNNYEGTRMVWCSILELLLFFLRTLCLLFCSISDCLYEVNFQNRRKIKRTVQSPLLCSRVLLVLTSWRLLQGFRTAILRESESTIPGLLRYVRLTYLASTYQNSDFCYVQHVHSHHLSKIKAGEPNTEYILWTFMVLL